MKKELEDLNYKIKEVTVKQEDFNYDSKEYLELLKEQLGLEKEKLELIELHKEAIEEINNFKIGSMIELEMILVKIVKTINSSMMESTVYDKLIKLLSVSRFEFRFTDYTNAKYKIEKVKDKLNKKYYDELKSNGSFHYEIKVIYNLLDSVLVKK